MGQFLRVAILGAFLSGQGFASLDLASEQGAPRVGRLSPASWHDPDLLAPKFAALALDGGHGTGYVQALILSALEEEFRKCLGIAPHTPAKDKPRMMEAFDFVGGTSTGALAATVLPVANETGARPLHDTSTLLRFYEGEGRDAQGHPTFAKPPFAAMYRMRDEEFVLNDFGLDVPLRQACVPIWIAATEVKNDGVGACPFYFKSYDVGDFPKMTAAAAVLCSCATPSYFRTMAMDDVCGVERYFVDGGIAGAWNTGCHILSEVLHRQPKLEIRNLLLMSVGVRNFVRESSGIGWARSIIDLSLDVQTVLNEDTLERFFKDEDCDLRGGYMRLAPQLSEYIAPHDINPVSFAQLRQTALDFIQERQDDIKEAAQKLAWRYQVKMGLRAAY